LHKVIRATQLQRTSERKIMQRYASLLGLGLAFAAAAAPLPVQEYTGRGTQVYRCEASGAARSWQLLGPDAHLYDAGGKIVARHFYGPSWQANDGSEITLHLLLASENGRRITASVEMLLAAAAGAAPRLLGRLWPAK
jgi:Protein of unknown function (DUF3455)